jgi:nicotinamidase-related amidase
MSETTNAELKKIFRDHACRRSECVHMAIDLQWDCAVDYPDVAEHIIRNLRPAFRKLAIPTYWIYTDNNDGPEEPKSPFYKFKPSKHPAAREREIKKNAMSAFAGGDVDQYLQNDSKKFLLVSGFYSNQCVLATVLGALENYNVIVMSDATNEHQSAFNIMAREGALIMTSSTLLAALPTLTA